MSTNRSRLRLEIAMERAKQNGDAETWLSLAASFHRHVIGIDEERELVAELIRQSNSARSKYRTRPARLLTAQQLVGLIPPELVESCLFNHADLTSAFLLAEATRCRLLLDAMANLYRPPADTASARAAELEADVFAYATQSNRSGILEQLQLLSLLPIVPVGPDPTARVRTVQQLEGFATEEGWGFTGVAEPVSLDEIQGRLLPSEALVEFVQLRWAHGMRPTHAAMVVTAGRVQSVRLPQELISIESGGTIQVDGAQPIDFTGLGGLVAELRVAISNRDDDGAVPLLRNLYEYLLKPILSLDGIGHVEHFVIVPTGVLHLVPWPALLAAPRDFFGRRRFVSLAPSASIWARQAAQSVDPPSNYVGFGDPKFQDHQFPRLKNAGHEVTDFAQRLPGWKVAVRTQKEATKAEFLMLAPTSGVLHVATHGEFPEINPLDEHAFILAAADHDDGRLTARRISGMNLSSVGIALLNICNGAIYRVGPGDEPFGLVAAAMTAGAQNIIAPLWPIADEFARTAALCFADSLRSSSSVAAALRSVFDHFADEAPIVDWAAYCLIGLGRGVEWSRQTTASRSAPTAD